MKQIIVYCSLQTLNYTTLPTARWCAMMAALDGVRDVELTHLITIYAILTDVTPDTIRALPLRDLEAMRASLEGLLETEPQIQNFNLHYEYEGTKFYFIKELYKITIGQLADCEHYSNNKSLYQALPDILCTLFLPDGYTYPQYIALPDAERADLKRKLLTIPIAESYSIATFFLTLAHGSEKIMPRFSLTRKQQALLIQVQIYFLTLRRLGRDGDGIPLLWRFAGIISLILITFVKKQSFKQ